MPSTPGCFNPNVRALGPPTPDVARRRSAPWRDGAIAAAHPHGSQIEWSYTILGTQRTWFRTYRRQIWVLRRRPRAMWHGGSDRAPESNFLPPGRHRVCPVGVRAPTVSPISPATKDRGQFDGEGRAATMVFGEGLGTGSRGLWQEPRDQLLSPSARMVRSACAAAEDSAGWLANSPWARARYPDDWTRPNAPAYASSPRKKLRTHWARSAATGEWSPSGPRRPVRAARRWAHEFAYWWGRPVGPPMSARARAGVWPNGPRGWGFARWAEREQKRPSSTISPFPLFFSGFYFLFLLLFLSHFLFILNFQFKLQIYMLLLYSIKNRF
jgi:hypothetical protein